METDLTDFTEQPVVSIGSMKDLDLVSIDMERIDNRMGPAKEVQGIYELWVKNGVIVYRDIKGYYSMMGAPRKKRRYYFEDEDRILNHVGMTVE